MSFRVGLGQDSHKINLKFQISKIKTLTPPSLPLYKGRKGGVKKPLVLGGILIDKNIEVVANSDGDVILHALCNALSSACGGPSLSFFADPLCKRGIRDSKKYLGKVLGFVRTKSFRVNNVSISVEAGKPKLEKFSKKIQKNLAKLLDIKRDQIGITFTSGEELTSFGRGEGIQVFCVASLVRD